MLRSLPDVIAWLPDSTRGVLKLASLDKFSEPIIDRRKVLIGWAVTTATLAGLTIRCTRQIKLADSGLAVGACFVKFTKSVLCLFGDCALIFDHGIDQA
jgi:hypothetical protein